VHGCSEQRLIIQIGYLLGIVVFAVAIYISVLKISKSKELSEIHDLIKRKKTGLNK